MQALPHNLNTWILITGASSGIGECFAKRLAKEGNNLILVARSQEKLKQLAQSLEDQYQTKVLCIPADLVALDAPSKIYKEINERGISLFGLINNAGCGAGGKFIEVSRERYLQMIDLNIRSLVELTHLFLPGMIEQKKGFVLNVSSTASYQPIPYSSVYAASKAFVTSFSEALWLETKNSGVRILNLCPGLTKTNFGIAAGIRDFRSDPIAEKPEQVVDAALRALKKNIPTVISGWHNWLLAVIERLVPHRFVLWASLALQNSRRMF